MLMPYKEKSIISLLNITGDKKYYFDYDFDYIILISVPKVLKGIFVPNVK